MRVDCKTTKLFKGTFNYNGETTTLFSRATSRAKAFSNFMERLSDKYGTSRSTMFHYFVGTDRCCMVLDREVTVKMEAPANNESSLRDVVAPIIKEEVAAYMEKVFGDKIIETEKPARQGFP